jgi:hypothetical protein
MGEFYTLKICTGGFDGPVIAKWVGQVPIVPAIGDSVVVGSTQKRVLDREFCGYTRPAGYDHTFVVTLVVEAHGHDVHLLDV